MTLTNRQPMLDNVRRFWIDGVLENSLHGAVLMQLGLQAQPEQVKHPWDVKIRHEGTDRSLPDGTRILDVFDYSGGSLLILGDPGSGKTTLLLELTRDLLKRAELQADYCIPVVFNLSSWAKDRPDIDAWMVDELNIKYQVARGVAEKWVKATALLPLLDGLDEVSETVRDACVTAINDYHRLHPDVPLVVCSRTHDYDILTTQLDFHTAVMIDPLSATQVDAYLASFGQELDGLRQQMASDGRLRALAETPLTLSIMTLAYQGIDPATLPEDVSMDVQRHHLFDTYIEKMFERHRKSQDQPPEETLRYLSWLAGRMVERRQTLFHIENLQWDWLETRLQHSVYKLFSRLSYGAGIGAIAGGLAAIVMMVMISVLLNEELRIYQSGMSAWISGIYAILIYALFGSLVGILCGGTVFGLTGLLAFTADRLQVKGIARSYRSRIGAVSIGIGVFSGAIGGWVMYALSHVINGGVPTLYMHHLYEIGQETRRMEGLEVAWFWMQVGMLLGLFGGIFSTLLAKWWTGSSGRKRQIVGGVYGLLTGAAFTLCVWFSMATPYTEIQYFWLPFAIFSLFTGGLGIVAGGFKDEVESAESLGWRWNWRWAKVGLAVAFVIAGLDYLSLQSSYYPPDNYLVRALTIFIPAATLCVLVGGVAAGLRKSEKVDSRTQPNQGIRHTAKSAIKITAAFSIVGIFISLIVTTVMVFTSYASNGISLASLSDWELSMLSQNLRGAIALGVASGLVVGLALGGTDTVIKHLLVRFMLWRNGDIPLNYAQELDHAASLILLRKVGGGYIFVHRYLLEHFARMTIE